MRQQWTALALVPALLAGPAPAQSSTACAISAYVIDSDPAGTNIRAGPFSSARMLATIPGGADAVVIITGTSGSWFRISDAEEVGDNNHDLFRGSGWIHRALLGIDVAYPDQRLYAAPSSRSRVTARLVAGDSQVTLLGCKGRWAQVRFGKRVGWLSPDGQCASPLTTCA